MSLRLDEMAEVLGVEKVCAFTLSQTGIMPLKTGLACKIHRIPHIPKNSTIFYTKIDMFPVLIITGKCWL